MKSPSFLFNNGLTLKMYKEIKIDFDLIEVFFLCGACVTATSVQSRIIKTSHGIFCATVIINGVY